MEEINLEEMYDIDKDRLFKYYERIKNQFSNLDPLKIVAKFLNNQSIGDSIDKVYNIFDYYNDKIKKSILDFAFEWIRAQKIRLEYKKYLIRAQYSDYELAIDDCAFLFFIKYDKYLRTIFKDDVKEFEISALYEIFFIPFQISSVNIKNLLERHRNKIPTLFKESKRINTSLITLRLALEQIIKSDYDGVLLSRREEAQKKDIMGTKAFGSQNMQMEFNGTLLERMIKTYCFNKREIKLADIDNGIVSFLNSYFKFGKFYDYDEFEEMLKDSLAEYINNGLTERYKKPDSLEFLKKLIKEVLSEFRTVHTIKKLDGAAWVNDLKSVLKNFFFKFINDLT